MIPRELIEGVKQMLLKGAPRDVIETFLLQRGWSNEDAQVVFSRIDAESKERKEKEEREKRAQEEQARVEKEEREKRLREILRMQEEELQRKKVEEERRAKEAFERKEVERKEQERREIERKEIETKKAKEAALRAQAQLNVKEKERSTVSTQGQTKFDEQKKRNELRAEIERFEKRKAEQKSAETPEKSLVLRTQTQVPTNQRKILPAVIHPKDTIKVEEEVKQLKIVKAPLVERPQEPKHREVRPQPSSVPPLQQSTPKKVEPEPETPDTEMFGLTNLSSPLTLALSAFSLVRARFWNLFFLAFMVSVIYLILYVIGSYIFTADLLRSWWAGLTNMNAETFASLPFTVFAILLLGFVLLSLLLWLPASYILALTGKKISFRDLFGGGFTQGFSLAVSIIFSVLFVTSGLILFLIPGLMFSVWFVFAPIIVVSEKATPLQALLISRELVRGNFGAVLSREIFFLIPTLIIGVPVLLLLSPLSILGSLGVGAALILVLFIVFGLLLLIFGFMLFYFAYHIALYKEVRARTHSVKLSGRFAKLLPFLLIIPLIIALSLAFYASSQV